MKEKSAVLELKNVTKYYSGKSGSKLMVLEDICLLSDFNNLKGSLNSILAPFGSGKSTLLRIVSALESPSSGSVLLNGSPYEKSDGRIVYIPEKPSSFPWMNVISNIVFAARISGNKNARIEDIIALVGLTGYEKHFPHEKSTGFRFRIALARALAVDPLLILLDDPFKNLNAETKKEIYGLIRKVRDEVNLNFLLCTTNITEALSLSDKIYLMKRHPGQIFKEIETDREKLSAGRENLFREIRNEIESAYTEFEGTPLIAEIQFK